MECEPTLKVELLKVAEPAEFSVPLPSVVAPSKKLTEPVGIVVLPAGPVTVAVNITDWPKVDGFSDETSTVVDAAVVAGTPIPCTYTGCGLPCALSVTRRVPGYGKPPATPMDGLNWTPIVQLAPGGKLDPQVLAWRM